MCPNDSAASIDPCGTCGENYGEYVVQASNYLTQIATHRQKHLEELCQPCKKYCNNNKNNADTNTPFYHRGISVSCAGCSNRFPNSQNAAAIGCVDAVNFISDTSVPVYYKEENTLEQAMRSRDNSDARRRPINRKRHNGTYKNSANLSRRRERQVTSRKTILHDENTHGSSARKHNGRKLS
jgi:hypothetical protein